MNRMLTILLMFLFSLLALDCTKDESNLIQPTNNAPSTPSNPNPSDGATGVSPSPVLSWTSSDPDGDSVKYDLYFSSVNPPNTLLSGNLVFPNYTASGLDSNRTYYWRVNAKDSKGAASPSPIWHFTTIQSSGQIVIPLELANWKCFTQTPAFQYLSPASGVYEKVIDGLKIYGNQYRGNEWIFPVPTSQHPIINKTIYVKWKANGGGNFMEVVVYLLSDSAHGAPRFMSLTTHNSYDGSVVIMEDVWYYTRVVVTSNLVTATSATGHYDNNGGTVVQTRSISLTQAVTFFMFGLSDAYAGTAAYAILGEARIE